MARRSKQTDPKKRGATGAPKLSLPLRTQHIVLGVLGVTLLLIYFGGMIIEGSAPRAPDTSASEALSHMSVQKYRETGTMPLWTPAVFSGMPSYGAMVYTHENPISWVIRAVTPANLGVRLFIFFGIAGFCTYLLLIRYGRSPIAAFFAAAVYVFTPYFPGLIAAGHNNKLWAAALIPPLLLVTDGLIRNRSIRAFAWFVLIASWQLWVRHPQVTYYGVMLIGAIVIADVLVQSGGLIPKVRRLVMNGALIGGGLAVTLGIVALPYLPVLDFTRHSVRGGAPSAASELIRSEGVDHDRSWEFATQWSMHPKELITFVAPSFYGLWNDPRYDQRTHLEAHTYWGYMPFTQSTHYFGLIPLLLALMVRPTRQGIIWGCIGFSVAALLIGLGSWFPVLYGPAYNLLPLFSQFRVPSKIYMLLPLSVAIIGAWTLDRVLKPADESQSGKKAARKRLPYEENIAYAAALAVAAFGIGVLLFHGSWSWAARPQESMYPPQILSQLTALRGSLISRDLFIALILAATTAAGIFLVSRRRVQPVIVGALLVGVTIVDLWRLDFVFFDALPPTFAATPPRRPQVVDVIRQDAGTDTLFRVAPVHGRAQGGGYSVDGTNEWGRWGLQSVSGYHAAKLRIYDDLMIVGGIGQKHILNMLNARYIIGPAGLTETSLVPLNEGPQVAYRNRDALPRAWWVADVLEVQREPDALSSILSPGFDPRNEAVVLGRTEQATYDVPATPPQIVDWGFEHIVMEVDVGAPAFLVLSEIYYPRRWKATIDGKPTDILQTNFVLRGIEVPAGASEIKLEYYSPAYVWAVRLTGTLFPLLLIVLGIEEYRAWRRRTRRTVTQGDGTAA